MVLLNSLVKLRVVQTPHRRSKHLKVPFFSMSGGSFALTTESFIVLHLRKLIKGFCTKTSLQFLLRYKKSEMCLLSFWLNFARAGWYVKTNGIPDSDLERSVDWAFTMRLWISSWALFIWSLTRFWGYFLSINHFSRFSRCCLTSCSWLHRLWMRRAWL